MASPLLPNPEDRSIQGVQSTLGGDDFEVEPDESTVVENKDGSADLVLDEAKKPDSVAHEENLALHLEESEMSTIATELLRKIEKDKEARSKRDEQYEEGLRRTGMGNDAPGGATFMGASRVVHPMLAEGCVDFAASAMKELFPPNGPAKAKIEGDASQKKLEVAKRQERYLNWQLTDQISEYADELEQTLTQVPMGGSQYMKFWQDRNLRRIACEFVPIDDVYIPFSCTDFYSAQRITHVQRLTEMVYQERVDDGLYRDVEVGDSGQVPERTKSAVANDKIEGKEELDENTDDERLVYEVNTFLELSIDSEERLPYLISIDEKSGKVVSIYRNWEELDEAKTRLEWMVEYGFIAWRGAYKIGLPHLIGGLSAAATGALRALLDSAHINTVPGFLRLKGARLGGQSKQIDPQSGVEIEATGAVDDINKLVMRLPYNQPSPTLFQLLGWLTDAAKGVVSTAEEKIADATSQMPVGTTLALIEQGSKVFASIHARLHRSQRRAFSIIARLNAKHMNVRAQMKKFGEVIATKEDFAQPLAVIPVSDPNIFSDAQRYAQMQMVLANATGQITGPLHNLYNTLRRIYEIAKIPEIDSFLPKPKNPTELNAAAENSAAMMGTPIVAFPEQDHLAHIEVHMRFLMDPMLGGNPSAAPKSMPALMEHIKQHLSFLYAKTMFDIATQATGADLGAALQNKQMSPMVDKVLAAASRIVHKRMMEMLQPLGGPMNAIIQQIAAMQPPPPMDPSQAAIQTAKIGAEAEKAAVDAKAAVEQEKARSQAEVAQGKLAIDQQGLQLEGQRVAIEDRKAQADIEEGQHKGMVEEMKLASQIQHQELQLKEDASPGNQVSGA